MPFFTNFELSTTSPKVRSSYMTKLQRERFGLRTSLNAIFLILIFSLGFMQPSVMISGMSVVATDALFLVAGALWLIGLLSGKVKFRYDRTFLLFGLYAGGLLLSVVFSEYIRTSALKFPGEIYLIGLAVMTFNLADRWAMVRKIIIAWLAASVISALIGVVTV